MSRLNRVEATGDLFETYGWNEVNDINLLEYLSKTSQSLDSNTSEILKKILGHNEFTDLEGIIKYYIEEKKIAESNRIPALQRLWDFVNQNNSLLSKFVELATNKALEEKLEEKVKKENNNTRNPVKAGSTKKLEKTKKSKKPEKTKKTKKPEKTKQKNEVERVKKKDNGRKRKRRDSNTGDDFIAQAQKRAKRNNGSKNSEELRASLVMASMVDQLTISQIDVVEGKDIGNQTEGSEQSTISIQTDGTGMVAASSQIVRAEQSTISIQTDGTGMMETSSQTIRSEQCSMSTQTVIPATNITSTQIGQLELENEELARKLEELEQEKGELKQWIEELAQKLDELEQKREESEQELAELRQELKESNRPLFVRSDSESTGKFSALGDSGSIIACSEELADASNASSNEIDKFLNF